MTEVRTFGATFDFGGVEPGTSFSIELRDQDRTVTGVVAAGRTTTTATTTTTTTTTATATATATTTTTTTMMLPSVETEQPITAQSVSEGGLPGFDVPIALVALVLGAVLVLRRTR